MAAFVERRKVKRMPASADSILNALSDLNRSVGGLEQAAKEQSAQSTKLFDKVDELAEEGCSTGKRYAETAAVNAKAIASMTEVLRIHAEQIASLNNAEKRKSGKAAMIGGSLVGIIGGIVMGIMRGLEMWQASRAVNP